MTASKKAPATKKATKNVSPFLMVNNLLSNINKTDEDKTVEKATDFINRSVIKLNQKINNIEIAEIPSINLDIDQVEEELKIAKKDLQTSRFAIPGDYELTSYLNRLESTSKTVQHLEGKLASLKTDKGLKEYEIEKLKQVRADFQLKS